MPNGSRVRAAVGRGQQHAVERWSGSHAEHVWKRLNAFDYVNRAMLFAATLLLGFVPFLIVLQALAGRSAATGAIRRFGLDRSAADALKQVFTSPSSTSSSVQGLGYLFFVLSGIAGASAVQELYERVFDVPERGLRGLPRRLLWLAFLIAVLAVSGAVSPWLLREAGPVAVAVLALVVVTGFWWLTMWLLLGGRRGWRDLLPAAIATGVSWLAMTIVFRLTMSHTITSNYREYGAIGVIFALMSFLIAVGVVIVMGAVIGEVWRERHPARSASSGRDDGPGNAAPATCGDE